MKAVPNQYGVFSKETAPGVEAVAFTINDGGRTWMQAFVLEVEPGCWAWGMDVRLRTSGASMPIGFASKCVSRDQALSEAIDRMRFHAEPYLATYRSETEQDTARRYIKALDDYQNQGRLF